MTNLDAITYHPEARDGTRRIVSVGARRPAIAPARFRQVLIGGLLVSPLLLFLAAAFYYPLAYTLAESVTPEKGAGWTLANYAAFLGSRDGLGVLALTLGLALAATLLSILLSLPLALYFAPAVFRPARAAVPDDAADHYSRAGGRARPRYPL